MCKFILEFEGRKWKGVVWLVGKCERFEELEKVGEGIKVGVEFEREGEGIGI